MINIYNRYKKCIWACLSIFVFVFFCTFITLTYKEDEEVTMGFMHHTYLGIINIDSLDVHPPLYYLLLKLFLTAFTFWTKSLIVKTLFARIFSIIIFILVFCVLRKIFSLSNIHINIIEQFLLFCIMPSILEVATHLRMYELATLAITIEYYNLKKFCLNGKNINIFLAFISGLFAAYTHYFVAIISGILFFVFFIKMLFYKNHKKVIKIIISSMLLIIAYIPMIPYVLNQFINRSKFPSKNSGVFDQALSSLVQLTSAGSIVKELFDLVLLLLLIYFTFNLLRHINNQSVKNMYYEIGSCVIISIIIDIVISIIYSPFFECRFIFPLISIYFFLLISTILYLLNNNNIIIHKSFIIIFIIVSIFIGASDVNKFKQNVEQYDIPSIHMFNQLNYYNKHNIKYVDVTKKNYPTKFGEALYAPQMSDYLQSNDKDAIVYSPNKTNIYTECNDNKKFVKKLFNNLYIK